jgi:pimeloyl-ACP methyl ester carboxylesterase
VQDRGAEFAYALSALYPSNVLSLSFCEMLLSGYGLEASAAWNPTNVAAQFRMKGVWCWHLPFFWIPHVPELLITGKEREFWEHFIKAECYDPSTIEERVLDHWIECVKQPGCLSGILATYRCAFKSAEINRTLVEKGKLEIPVMSVGAPEFFGPQVEECAREFATNVVSSEIFEECGHSLALEKPERLAASLRKFIVEAEQGEER